MLDFSSEQASLPWKLRYCHNEVYGLASGRFESDEVQKQNNKDSENRDNAWQARGRARWARAPSEFGGSINPIQNTLTLLPAHLYSKSYLHLWQV